MTKKDKKCQNPKCKALIPKGSEAYINGKVVCQNCFDNLKHRKNGIETRTKEQIKRDYLLMLAK